MKYLILIICLYGCANDDKDIEGQYIFNFPTGEVELLSISSDNLFIQEIYMSNDNYINGTDPKYKSTGNWVNTGKDYDFLNWLSYSDNRNPKEILNHPIHVDMMDVYFINSVIDSKDYISIYRENEFIFKRVNEN